MSRLHTIMTCQWADLDIEQMCKQAASMGYDGLELACWGGQLDPKRAAEDDAYVAEVKAILEKYGMKVEALCAHIIGQCVGDYNDPRLDNFAPAELAGQPDAIRAWGIETMKYCAIAAKKMGAYVVTGFTGSPIWKYLYSFPQTTEEMVEAGFQEIYDLWCPILDVFKENGIKFALEVHPGEIAFDYYTTKRLLEKFADRPEFGLNLDPSHLIWQGVTPHVFLEDFIDRVYHVHMKDAAVTLNGRSGLLDQMKQPHRYDEKQVSQGLRQMLWGYFKKMVIADRAAVLVNTVLDDPWSYSGSILAVGVLFYCIQLYGDFSGGIDIARGVARMFGIDLAENFRRPIFSTSLTDFWRRWHITLGAWMRDYLFYPLSLSKPFGRLGRFTRKHIKGKLGKILPTSLATFIVYFVIGIWYGANWRYVAFGFWNGGIITLSLLLAPQFLVWKEKLHINDKSLGWHIFQVVRTNILVFFGRYITRAPRFLTAVWMVKETFLHPNLPDLWNGTLLSLGLTGWDLAVLWIGVAIMLAAEWYQEKQGPIRPMLETKPAWFQWFTTMVLPLAILFCLGVLRADYIPEGFIYQQF